MKLPLYTQKMFSDDVFVVLQFALFGTIAIGVNLSTLKVERVKIKNLRAMSEESYQRITGKHAG